MNRRGALGRMLTIPVAAASRATAAAPVPLSVRKKRIFYNDDGDTGLQSYRGPLRPEIATDCVNMLLGTAVTSLVLCVSYSDWAIFPSKVVSMLDWRETPSSRRSPYWRHVYQFYREVREKGWDIPKLALAHAAEKGLEFIPSMRMNDTHFAIKVHPDVNPLTSKFWMEHRDLAINPDLKWSPSNFTEYAFDFRHEVVRRRRLSHAFEIIDRYAADGFELDWTRHYQMFRKGEAQPGLITDMVRQVRRRLDQRAGRTGRRLLLICRVPASLSVALSYGFDVASWVRERLVDVLVPSSPNRNMSFDMPIDEWMRLVAGTTIEVHADSETRTYHGDGDATSEMYRAAASNYFQMGAHGFYFMNLFTRGYPLPDDSYVIMRDVSDPASLDRRNKLFMATRQNWRRDTDTLPVRLSGPDRHARVGLMVGDDLAAAAKATTLEDVVLRLRVDQVSPEDRFDVTLNGAIVEGIRSTGMHDNRDAGEWGRRLLKSPWAWLEASLVSTLPRAGDNLISVRVLKRPARELTLNDIELSVRYNPLGKNGADIGRRTSDIPY